MVSLWFGWAWRYFCGEGLSRSCVELTLTSSVCVVATCLYALLYVVAGALLVVEIPHHKSL